MFYARKIVLDQPDPRPRAPRIRPLPPSQSFVSGTSLRFEGPDGRTRSEWLPARVQHTATTAALGARRAIVANFAALMSAIREASRLEPGQQLSTPALIEEASRSSNKSLRKAARGYQALAPEIDLIVHGHLVIRELDDGELKLHFEHGRASREYTPATLMQLARRFELFAAEKVRRLVAPAIAK